MYPGLEFRCFRFLKHNVIWSANWRERLHTQQHGTSYSPPGYVPMRSNKIHGDRGGINTGLLYCLKLSPH